MGKAFTIVSWVLVVAVVFCVCFALWELLIYRHHFSTGAKVQYRFKACPTVLPVAIMGLEGDGNYYGTTTPAVKQDRVNIAYCEGSPCTGHYGQHSAWIRSNYLDTSSHAAAGHAAAARHFSSCLEDEDCFNLPQCNLGDPEQTYTVNGIKYSQNCPYLAGGNGKATSVPSTEWTPLRNGPGQLWGGPLGCPVYNQVGDHNDDQHPPLTNTRVPCINNRCAMFLPNFEALGTRTEAFDLWSTVCVPLTDPMKVSPQQGKWSVDKTEILQTWGKRATMEAKFDTATANNRQHAVPAADDGLFVPCDGTTGRCKLYGPTGVTGKGPALPECKTSDNPPCPLGQQCVTCPGDPACPSDPATWSCPVNPATGVAPSSCQVCVGSPARGSVIRTEFLAEGTIVGKNENGYNVRWDAVQCLYPYRNGKYQRCRIVRSEANKAIWNHIFGTADPSDTEHGNGNPIEIKITDGQAAGTFWPLKAVGLQKSELERIHRYSITNRDVNSAPDLGKAPDGNWGKCIPSGGIFVD